nr:MAG TPA: hypothetical protein [Caudoviricetes sp.]
MAIIMRFWICYVNIIILYLINCVLSGIIFMREVRRFRLLSRLNL